MPVLERKLQWEEGGWSMSTAGDSTGAQHGSGSEQPEGEGARALPPPEQL